MQVIKYVGPGGTFGWIWDQKDNGGEQASAGKYYAKLFSIGAGILVAEFHIIGE
ncbi:MAG: hypothetical protein QXO86_07265 [Nitrososphaerota archaeon]